LPRLFSQKKKKKKKTRGGGKHWKRIFVWGKIITGCEGNGKKKKKTKKLQGKSVEYSEKPTAEIPRDDEDILLTFQKKKKDFNRS